MADVLFKLPAGAVPPHLVCPEHRPQYCLMTVGASFGGRPDFVLNPRYLDRSVMDGCDECLALQVMES